MDVSAAVIIKNSKVFVAQRKNNGLWEFPGGKREENETLEESLKRELKEELNIEAEIKDFVEKSSIIKNGTKIDIYAYLTDVADFENMKLNDHDRFIWSEISELENINFSKGDIPIAEKIIEKYS